MSLPDIAGLYDNVSTIGEIKVGSTVDAIYNANSNSLEWIYQIPTLIFNQSSCPCLKTTWGNDHPTGTYNHGMDFITDDGWIGNKPVVLCLGNSTFTDAIIANINPWSRRDNRSTTAQETVVSNNLYGHQRMNSSRVILEADTREHYIALPLITAKALNTNSKITSVAFGDYVTNYIDSHPYIEQITLTYYYKPILQNTTLTQKNFSFAMPDLKRRQNYLYFSPLGTTSHFIYGARNTSIVTNFGTTIFQAPALTNAIITEEGIQRYASSLNQLNGTHGAGYHYYTGDVTNNYPPTLYIDIDQAVNIINSVGFWWGETYDDIKYNALGVDTTSNKIHCPKITSGGATTTSDWKGSEIKNHWNDNGYRQNGGISLVYNSNVNINEPVDRSDEATEDPDPLSDDSQQLEILPPKYTGVGCFSTYYAMSMGQIRRFNDDMWTSDEDWLTAVILGLRLWGSNPMEAIMSLRLYPFDVTDYVTTTGHENIKLGRVVMPTATGEVMSSNSTAILHLGSVYLRPEFNDFRDYYPYTQIQLYVPFIGFIDINPNEFMGHILKVDLAVDLTTGTCEVCVFADSRPMIYKSGIIGVEIPISLNSMTQTSTAIMQGIFEISTSLGLTMTDAFIQSGGIKSLKINPSKTAGGGWNVGKEAPFDPEFDVSTAEIGDIAMNLSMGASSTLQSGASSPACNMTNTPFPYLLISQAITEIPENYAHTYGKVCHTSGALNKFHGFTVCRNVDATGITCTKVEQDMIKQLLEHGIYI